MRVIAALLLAAAAAACGGDASPRGDAVPETPSSAAAAFRDLGLRGAEAKVKVAYRVVDDRGETTQLAYSQDPPKRSFRLRAGGDETLLISDGDSFVACGSGACYDLPGLGAEAGAAGAAFVGAVTEAFDAFESARELPGFTERDARTIAGRAAVCASWRASAMGDAVEHCLDRQTGVPLSFTLNGDDGRQTLEATSFGVPSGSDFVAPHPVEPIPSVFPTE